jgi:hypothetical protein
MLETKNHTLWPPSQSQIMTLAVVATACVEAAALQVGSRHGTLTSIALREKDVGGFLSDTTFGI